MAYNIYNIVILHIYYEYIILYTIIIALWFIIYNIFIIQLYAWNFLASVNAILPEISSINF